MNKILTRVIAFSLGAAIGSIVTWSLVKEKYEKMAQDEIDIMKEYYTNKATDEQIKDEEVEHNEEKVAEVRPSNEKPELVKYMDIIKKEDYTKYSISDDEEETLDQSKVEVIDLFNDEEEVNDVERPYVIPPEEFGEFDDYDTVSLSYYADGVLTNDMDEIINNVDDIVGQDSLTHFGEYEDDSVFVRNDKLRTDYEILLDTRNYHSYIANGRPHQVEE